jgi:hypothetical protein
MKESGNTVTQQIQTIRKGTQMKHVMKNDDLSALPDLGDERERRRLGPAGMNAFSLIMRKWNVPAEESCQLLALPPGTAIDSLDPGALSEEQMLRISCVIGIYKALHTNFGDQLADRWISLPNSNILLGGQTALEYILRGGLDASRTVRNLLDARCAGN